MSSIRPITTLFEAASAPEAARDAQSAPASSNNRLEVFINVSSRFGAGSMSRPTKTLARRILLAAAPLGKTGRFQAASNT